MSENKRKIAILGGGVGGITTALELTRPELRDKYDITIYQLGWRIGGKGASGRNLEQGCRIEEHGLHVWAGLYDNAFRLMRGAYEELGRAPDAPLATWLDAFKPCEVVALEEKYNGEWVSWVIEPPTNDQLPGDPEAKLFLPFWSYIGEAFGFVLDRLKTSHRKRHEKRTSGAGFFAGLFFRLFYYTALTLTEIVSLAFYTVYEVGHLLTSTVGRLLPKFVRGGVYAIFHLLQRLGIWFVQGLVRFHWRRAKRHMDDLGARQAWIFMNFGVGFLRGIIDDDLFRKGFDSIEHLDFREWLGKHIVDDAHPGAEGESLTLRSPLARFLYDADFAYVNGDLDKMRFSAGAAVYTLFRLGLTWKGAVIWRMQAGMGDTIFTPAYQILKQRGVKFEYFQKVTKLETAGKSIDGIEIATQAKIVDSQIAYQPLVEVRGLDCWPSEPDWSQLVDGEKYAAEGIDFEDWCSPHLGTRTLVRGTHFDDVVLGISLGAHPYICGDLIDHSDDWKKMVDNVATIATQAGQLWLTDTTYEMGWTHPGHPLLATYDSSNFDTWADMTELLVREAWPGVGDESPLSIAYFCGPMQEKPLPTTPHGPKQSCEELDQKSANQTIRRRFTTFLEDEMYRLWPRGSNRGQFDWDRLVDNRPGSNRGAARLESQYFRANVQPTERYVMSLPGTSEHRLQPGASGFDNLYLAGDWTWSPFNGGCVEGATISGMLAANAMSGLPKIDSIVGLTFGWGSYEERLKKARREQGRAEAR
ncbi:MAG: NAD(P)-binding protein [Gemmatimonadota bacterium]|nr:NAD(P)-binding protein [Gemmatimonadota bacterium]